MLPGARTLSEKNFGLATRFPFAFLTKTRRINLAREIVVYPVVEPTDHFLEVLPMVQVSSNRLCADAAYDLYLIREYMPEDSARHVDWKATARTGSLKVREFSREDERKLRIVFDNPAPGVLHRRFTSARCAWRLRSPGISITKTWKSRSSRPDSSRPPMCLTSCIIWRWSSPEDATPVFGRLRVSDDYNVIVTARGQAEIPRRLRAASYVISSGTTTLTQRL